MIDLTSIKEALEAEEKFLEEDGWAKRKSIDGDYFGKRHLLYEVYWARRKTLANKKNEEATNG